MQDFWAVGKEEVIKFFQTDKDRGLLFGEVEKRQKQYGSNSFPTKRGKNIFKQILEAFTDPLEILLLAAAGISYAVGESSNFFWIVAIVIFMGVVKLITDYQASHALKQLEKYQEIYCRVIRNGIQETVLAADLVPGDIMFLSEGDHIGADGRILKESGSYTNDIALTGESLPVKKTNEVLLAQTNLAERKNMVYRGSFVTGGILYAVVTAVGLETEMGKIAKMVTETEESMTPLQKQLEDLGKKLSIATFIICGLVISVYIYRGMSLVSAFVTAVSLAIAFIPEALGAIMVVALALGVKEMVKEKAVVKKLHAAEALGSISIVCTDKTGTITLGQMKVETVWTVKNSYKSKILQVIADCNNNIGPTERALAELVTKIRPNSRISEIPFSSVTKFMQTVVKINGRSVTNIKGAPEVVFAKCKNADKNILEKAREFEEKGYRVIGVAQDDEFLGLVALADPPRPEVYDTVKQLLSAGIAPKIITGDSPIIALTIARQVGIPGDVLSGAAFYKASREQIVRTNIFARVEPKDKVAIIQILQEEGYLVAMIGDGINDCPGLVKADIGVAVGSGTDLAKDVADVVLLGAYEAIAGAVKMGRLILHRARLYIHALLSTNGAEVGIFITAAIFGWSMPLTGLQLLVINLLGDSWLSMALALEPAEKDLMKQKPRKTNDGVINRYMWFSIGLQSLIATIIISLAFYYTRSQTVVFLLFMTQKILRSAFTARSFTKNIWEIGFFTNKASLAAAVLSATIAGIAVYVLPLGMKPISLELLMIIVALGIIPAIVEEIQKYYLKIPELGESF